jgi:hypothetical protein
MDRRTGRTLLDRGSNDLIVYKGNGGLWRMGHEFTGGAFEEVACGSGQSVSFQVIELADELEIRWQVAVGSETLDRALWIGGESPILRFRVSGRVPDRHTVAVRMRTGLGIDQITMDSPGGTVIRPRVRLYEPTFWPLYRFARVQDRDSGMGVVLCQRRPGAFACRANGDIEAVAIRNATRERAFGFVPMLGMPATGHERSRYDFDYLLTWGAQDELNVDKILTAVREVWPPLGGKADLWPVYERLADLVAISKPGIDVAAVKYADRGRGVIVRLRKHGGPVDSAMLAIEGRPLSAAFECDARERDLEPLAVRDGAAAFSMGRSFMTVRLLF